MAVDAGLMFIAIAWGRRALRVGGHSSTPDRAARARMTEVRRPGHARHRWKLDGASREAARHVKAGERGIWGREGAHESVGDGGRRCLSERARQVQVVRARSERSWWSIGPKAGGPSVESSAVWVQMAGCDVESRREGQRERRGVVVVGASLLVGGLVQRWWRESLGGAGDGGCGGSGRFNASKLETGITADGRHRSAGRL
nr:hypothetical protein CFP56_24029 [Quercus suber]